MEQNAANQSWMHVAEIAIKYNNKVKPSERPQIKSSSEAYELLLATWNKDTIEYLEEAKLILLNTRSRVLGISNLSMGGINGTIVDVRIVYALALKAGANAIILAHNHPSGELLASRLDRQLTDRLVEAGKILNISFQDHLIITNNGYFSFAEDGLL